MSEDYEDKSVKFMEVMRRLLTGSGGISFQPPPGYEKRFKELSDVDLPKQGLSAKFFEDQLRNFSVDVRNAMPEEISEKLSDIPLALIERDKQSAGLWQHSESSASFIGIDYGLLRTIYAITTLTVYALDLVIKSKPVEKAANLLCDVFASHYKNTMFERSLVMELEMEESLRFLATHLISMQEMFVIAHEYGHHVLGHFKPDSTVPTKLNFDEELNRNSSSVKEIMLSFLVTNTPKQLQEVAADNFAFETMFAYCKSPTGFFAELAKTGLPPMPFFFDGFAAYEFVMYNQIIKDKHEKDLFLLKQFGGTHPPAVSRRDYFLRILMKK